MNSSRVKNMFKQSQTKTLMREKKSGLAVGSSLILFYFFSLGEPKLNLAACSGPNGQGRNFNSNFSQCKIV